MQSKNARLDAVINNNRSSIAHLQRRKKQCTSRRRPPPQHQHKKQRRQQHQHHEQQRRQRKLSTTSASRIQHITSHLAQRRRETLVVMSSSRAKRIRVLSACSWSSISVVSMSDIVFPPNAAPPRRQTDSGNAPTTLRQTRHAPGRLLTRARSLFQPSHNAFHVAVWPCLQFPGSRSALWVRIAAGFRFALGMRSRVWRKTDRECHRRRPRGP